MKFSINKPNYKKSNPKVKIIQKCPKNNNLLPNQKEFEPHLKFHECATLNQARDHLVRNPKQPKCPLVEPQLVSREYSAQRHLQFPSFLLPPDRYER